MKPELRAIKYGNEEYIALDVNGLESFNLVIRTSRNDTFVVEHVNEKKKVTVFNGSEATAEITELTNFDGTITYIPVYGKSVYHKNINLLEIDMVFNKLCKDNSIRQAFLDRLKMEYPEKLL